MQNEARNKTHDKVIVTATTSWNGRGAGDTTSVRISPPLTSLPVLQLGRYISSNYHIFAKQERRIVLVPDQ